MRLKKWLIVPSMIFVAAMGFFIAAPSTANPPPLPPVPGQAVLDQVIMGGGPVYTPLGAQNFVLTRLAAFNGVFDGVENLVSVQDTVHYIDTLSRVRETVLPLNNSASALLRPEFVAPGTDPRPGKIVGAVYQPGRGNRAVQVVVAIFKPEAFQCMGCEPPEKVRFYYNDTRYNEYSIVYGRFLDPNGDNVLEAVDEGAVIAHKHSCVTVGLEQVCWEPYSYPDLREEPRPKDVAYDAYTEFKDIYDLQVDFYVDDAVPDLIGPTVRSNCAAQLAAASSANVPNCMPNLIFTAAKESRAGQPMAIWSLRDSADLRAHRTDGTFVGNLPPGRYLVIDATPHITTPGQVGVLFLVNANRTDHYLIPSVVVQGFGQSSAIDEHTAGIKDGFAWFRRW